MISSVPGSTSRHRVALTCVLLTLITWAVYWPVLHSQFTNYDDDVYVTANAHVRSGLTWEGIRWAFTSKSAGNWHPLTWMSHMLDCQLYGLNPAGHHATNLLLHTANVVLLFLLLMRMTGTLGRSAFVAALFAWHPLHVESVAWVAERKDVLSAFFGLLTIWAYAFYVEESTVQGSRFTIYDLRFTSCGSKRSVLYGLALFAFALGLMSKPMLVTLPFVLLLLDYWPLGEFQRFSVSAFQRFGVQNPEPEAQASKPSTFNLQPSTFLPLLLEKLPFLVLSGISCAVTISAQAGAVGGLHLPLSERVGNVVISYGRYILQTVWPTRLAVLYPFSPQFPFWQLALAIVGVGCLSWLAIRWAKQSPYLFTGWFWFLGTLVPVIGIVQVGLQSMADRYTYIPSIGLFVIAAWGGYELLSRWRLPPVTTTALAALPVAACILLTRAQLSHWKDSVTLFQNALRWTTNNYIAENNLGEALLDRGETDAAREHFKRGIRICPTDADAWSNLGMALMSESKFDEAVNCYRRAVQLQPQDADFHHNLACALARMGAWKEAIAELETSIRIDPDQAPVHADLARSFDTVGRVPDAETQWKLVLDREPDNVEALFRLGLILVAERDFEGARRHLERAVRLRPGDPEVRLQLGSVLLALGSNDEASRQLSEVARINPTNVVARFNLALVLERLGRAREAVDQYREVVSLDPRMPAALNNLAWILASNPDPKVRNGAEAVQFAEQACRLAGYRDARLITTLAVAYAEAGRFQDAAGTAAKAEALAQQGGNAQLAGEYRKLGDLFRSGQPYHPTDPSK